MWLNDRAKKLRSNFVSWRLRACAKGLKIYNEEYARFAGVRLNEGDLISTTITARVKRGGFSVTAITVASPGSHTAQIFCDGEPNTVRILRHSN